MDADTKVRKAHIALMRHPETCMYSGVILMGKTAIREEIPTACTTGVDTYYGRTFMDKLSDSDARGIVLHENLHKALRHIMRYRKLMKDDAQLTNAAMDYVVNDIIHQLEDKALCTLPGGLWDARFRNWSVLEVYDYLKTGKPPMMNGGGGGSGGSGKGNKQNPSGGSLPSGTPKRGDDKVTIGGEDFDLGCSDTHDFSELGELSPDDLKKLDKQIGEALQQGGMLAGRMGANVPRVIKDALVVPVDWRAEMRDFFNQACRGHDEYTYRHFNRRWLADDYYLPGTEDETVGEVVVGIDTSGSIGGEELSKFATHLRDLCIAAHPHKVRVLWWDTSVHGEQVFTGNYDNIGKLLKPQGGGGTHAGCVAKYILKNRINADCVIMFTDGYTEDPVDWHGVNCPTLWLVTQNRQFNAPPGNRKVRVEKDQ